MDRATLSLRNRGVLAASTFTLVASGILIALVPQTVRGFFSSGFLPHAYCYLFDRNLIAVHLGSDTAIWLSYVSISLTLAYLVYRTRREIPFSWMFLAFGTFIIACGFTHFMEVVVLWKPVYWLSADVKLITAAASVITAIALPPLVPKVHEMISAAKTSNQHKLQIEIANRELFDTNAALKQEVTKRTQAEEQLRNLSGRLLQLQDNERRRLARELHDSTGQVLTAIQLNLSLASKQLAGTDGNARSWLDDATRLTGQAISEVRTMSYLLHPPMLEEAGLLHALRWYAEGFTQRSHIEIELQLPSHLDRLAPDLELAVFRIVQESLTNIHRHSRSEKADIVLSRNGHELTLLVRDYGTGIPSALVEAAENTSKGFGVGLRGMRERVRQLGGRLLIEAANPGTIVQASLPLKWNVASHQRTLVARPQY